MAHEVFIGVTQQVVALGAVAAEVERGIVEDGHQVAEAVHHLLALAELVGVVEVGDINKLGKGKEMVDRLSNRWPSSTRPGLRRQPRRG